VPLINHRNTFSRKIWQYLTNGVEILEENEWVGKWIPIVPIWGKELFITEAGGSKRMLVSLIRNGRNAQMGFNYARSCMMEAIGQVPRTNYLAAEGQFEGHEQEVAEAGRIPRPYLYYKPKMADDGQTPIPPPTREPFDPPLQNLALAGETFQRDIQSAVGMYNSSVGKNDTNVKSGKAIQELDEQSDTGSFHFISNYNRFIVRIGAIVNDLQSKVEITPRQVPIRMRDGKEKLVWINKQYNDENGNSQHHDMTLGEYDVTIAVGPNEDSQREEASDFLETLTEELSQLPIDPAIKTQLLALIIQLKQLGPIGDQMVKIINPQQGDPAQMQQQLQSLQQQLTQLQTENAALHEDRAKRVLEQQTKVQIEQMKQEGAGAKDAAQHVADVNLAQLANDVKVLIAEIQTKAQSESERNQIYKEFWLENHKAAHEVGMQAAEQEHQQSLATQVAANASAQQTSDQVHQQTMAQQAQPPEPEGQGQ
jgi:chorismate mutase